MNNDDVRKNHVKDHINVLVDCAKELYNDMQLGTRQCLIIQRFKV